ncbi:hypothetical protein HOG98_06745 [bacterium]|jgi:hypothetical protein|nr:hypothetical protein [bacterium]
MPIQQTTPQFSLKLFLVSSIFTVLFCLILAEVGLRVIFHLGHPVLYQTNENFGSRPKPNQSVLGANGSQITINNLSLRTDEKWNRFEDNSILFMGDSVTYGGSYIDNSDLFTTIIQNKLNVSEHDKVKIGNSGVNGWSVQNINGLIIDDKFRPSPHYVSFLIEGDFYRQMTYKAYGWTKSPRLALIHVGHHYWKLWKEKQPSLTVLKPSEEKISKTSKKIDILQRPLEHDLSIQKKNARESVLILKSMTTYLNSLGFTHHIVISPTKAQVEGVEPIDDWVLTSLKAEGLDPVYMLKDVQKEIRSNSSMSSSSIYHDVVHLTKQGHELWAMLILKYLKDMYKIVELD